MKYAVDQIIDNIVILENIKTGEKKEVAKEILPSNIKEGNILKESIKYEIDLEEEKIIRERIKNKLEKLKEIRDEKI